jgi:hypothetical protein
MPDIGAAAGNGEAPVRRGRGRPPKVRAPLEAFSDEQFLEALAEANRIERNRSMAQHVAEQEAAGLHPAAFRLTRKLVKQGPVEARAFYVALGRYLTAAGLIEGC